MLNVENIYTYTVLFHYCKEKKKGEEHHLANLFNSKWLRKQMPKGFLTLDEQMKKKNTSAGFIETGKGLAVTMG